MVILFGAVKVGGVTSGIVPIIILVIVLVHPF